MRRISKIGSSTIDEIFSVCELKPTAYLNHVHHSLKIKDRIEEVGFKNLLGICLIKISALAGIKSQIDDFTKQDLLKMILSRFKTLSVDEIYKAFEMERYLTYGQKTDHFQLFDANYVSCVLQKYENWKIEEKKKLFFKADEIDNSKIPFDRKKIRHEFLEMLFYELNNHDYSDSAWLIYDDLKARKMIEISDKEGWELYETQLILHTKEIKETSKDRIDFKSRMADLQNTLDNKKPVAVVQNKCRSILVCRVMKNYTNDFEIFKKIGDVLD